MGLPLISSSRPVAPRPKPKVPASLPLVWPLPPMLRYSNPTLKVWLPLDPGHEVVDDVGRPGGDVAAG